MLQEEIERTMDNLNDRNLGDLWRRRLKATQLYGEAGSMLMQRLHELVTANLALTFEDAAATE